MDSNVPTIVSGLIEINEIRLSYLDHVIVLEHQPVQASGHQLHQLLGVSLGWKEVDL